jgi:ABC-type methionine transport system permease subunit
MQGQELIDSLWVATVETVYMVGISVLIAVILGLPLGLLLVMLESVCKEILRRYLLIQVNPIRKD